MPGANNDLNVLARSNVFEDLLHGRTPPINYEINVNQYKMGYYLVDGIYLLYGTITKSIKKRNLEKGESFFKSTRKCKKGYGTFFCHFVCTFCNHTSTGEVMERGCKHCDVIVYNIVQFDCWRRIAYKLTMHVKWLMSTRTTVCVQIQWNTSGPRMQLLNFHFLNIICFYNFMPAFLFFRLCYIKFLLNLF